MRRYVLTAESERQEIENLRTMRSTTVQCTCGGRMQLADVTALVEEKNALVRRLNDQTLEANP